MATTVKYWRESASLIMASKFLGPSSNSKPVPVGSHCQETKSKLNLNNVTPNPNVTHISKFETDYDICVIKRSANSTFMPNTFAFPGGVVEDSDFSRDWLKIFPSGLISRLKNIWKRGGSGAPIFSRGREKQYMYIPSEVAFRICAIRETFEECGILLAVACAQGSNEDIHNTSSYSNPVHLPLETLDRWREKVHKDPNEFINMCASLQIVPEVWTLHEWANWLTPTNTLSGAQFKKRFDTVMFLSILDRKPIFKPDKREVEQALWTKPLDLLIDHEDERTVLAPPQYVELHRILNFTDLLSLHKYCVGQSNRVVRITTLPYKFSDCTIYVLPGDDLYPSDSEPYEIGELQLSSEESFQMVSQRYPTRFCSMMFPDRKNPHRTRLGFLCKNTTFFGHALPNLELQALLSGFNPKSSL